MAPYIPRRIFHLARLLYVKPETFGPTLQLRDYLKKKSLQLKKRVKFKVAITLYNDQVSTLPSYTSMSNSVAGDII